MKYKLSLHNLLTIIYSYYFLFYNMLDFFFVKDKDELFPNLPAGHSSCC